MPAPMSMSEKPDVRDPAPPPTVLQAYAMPIVVGLLILAAGLLPWLLLADVNTRVRPDLPWAALATVAYLALLVAWLNGWGPPRRTSDRRCERLRLWPRRTPDTGGLPAIAIVAAIVVLYLMWIAMGRQSAPPDLSLYPTTAYRWSMFVMGAVTAGVVEEIAFRGYMQTGIERFDRDNAIWITSLVFALSHVTQGVGAVLLLGPGLFIASVLFGVLARRTGTILPGIVLHVLGDLASVYFGALGGDSRLLFVAAHGNPPAI
jgi:membrane protease YdiL (CAAX protease family)